MTTIARHQQPSRTRRACVLYAEDDRLTSAAIVRLLTIKGFKVESAANGQEALEKLLSQPGELCGVIQGIDPQTRTLTIQSPKCDSPDVFAVKGDTKFIKDWKFTNDTALKSGLRACVYYRSPFFGKPFVTKIVWSNQRQP